MQQIDEQIVAYEYLILRVLAKYRIFQEQDNFMQVGRLAIWQAQQVFDASKGDFEMYAYMRVKFAIIREIRNNLKVTEKEVVMDDDPLMNWIDMLTEQKQLELDRPEWYWQLFSHEQRLIELLFYEGYRMKDVAQNEGVSYDVIKKRRKKILTKIREIIEKRTGRHPSSY